MLTIGLTGPSGAGKGLVSSLFARYGVPSVDTDALYHRLLVPPSACLNELAECFGQIILKPDGTLDRAALSAIVFAPENRTALEDLNRISHRHVLHKVRDILATYEREDVPAVLVDAPQLFESGFDTACDRVLAVLAPREVRLSRIMERDGLDATRAAARMDAQLPDSVFRERSDDVIINDGSADALDADVRRLLFAWGVPYEI